MSPCHPRHHSKAVCTETFPYGILIFLRMRRFPSTTPSLKIRWFLAPAKILRAPFSTQYCHPKAASNSNKKRWSWAGRKQKKEFFFFFFPKKSSKKNWMSIKRWSIFFSSISPKNPSFFSKHPHTFWPLIHFLLYWDCSQWKCSLKNSHKRLSSWPDRFCPPFKNLTGDLVNGSGVPIAISPYLRLEPPYCSSPKNRGASSSDRKHQKNKNKVFLSHKNKGRKTKRKKKNQFFKRSKHSTKIGYTPRTRYGRHSIGRVLSTKCAQNTRNSFWITMPLTRGYVTGARVGA